MVEQSESEASACHMVSSTTGHQGKVVYNVNIPNNGGYYLWLRAMGLGFDRNSFYVTVDSGEELVYHIPQVAGQWGIWGWGMVNPEQLPGAPATLRRPFALDAGNHTVTIRQREANSRLDALTLADSADFAPTGPLTPCATMTYLPLLQLQVAELKVEGQIATCALRPPPSDL